jgi:hypothetical protein
MLRFSRLMLLTCLIASSACQASAQTIPAAAFTAQVTKRSS